MTVIHIHPDSAWLEFHMKVAGAEFLKFADFVNMLTINIYGELNENLLEQLRKKNQMLGNATVLVHGFHARLARFGGY